MTDEICRSCIDCRVTNCSRGKSQYPDFCPTLHTDKSLIDHALAQYQEPENHAVAIASAEVEGQFYGKMTRLEETAAFAEKLKIRKIGIAMCVGLIKEAGIVGKFFRHKGFEVVGIACKVGAIPKSEIGIPKYCEEIGPNLCNPILQAEYLNAEETELNVVIGLCVGHDALFTKHSKALCTTLIAKDRVLGHNPAAAVYLSDSYYSKLMD